jgi:CRISPR-associated protein Cmr1
MKSFKHTLRFNTPAFLGNAEQSSQWRTPPIKAQLRQWWRMAWAADHEFLADVSAMRREEGRLFGVASDGEGDSRKSLVRIRLDKWDAGKLNNWQGPDQSVSHPEVKNREGRLVPVGSQLYLGYGPLTFRRGTALKANAAIQAGESATLSLAVPTTHQNAELSRLLERNVPRIERALWLMDRYGTLGGRGRNGWGSFALISPPTGEGRGEGATLTGATPLRPWRDALALDWPHALGQDEKGALIWQTPQFQDWELLMRELAVIKIGLRTQFRFTTWRNSPRTEERHWLSYPITNHSVQAWGNNARLPNSLRFKVRNTVGDKLVGVIFHVPCLPPPAFNPNPNRQAIVQVWSQVHRFLDGATQQLTRIGE